MSVALLPRYPIPGYEEFTPEEAAELLHQEKNRPEGPPTAVLRKVTRPYGDLTADEKAFPAAMYREWKDSDKQKARARAAARLQMNLTNVLEAESIDQFIGEYDSCLAKDQAAKDVLRGQGWADSPTAAKAMAFQAHRVIATDAAVSYHDDRHLSPKAQDERTAIDDAAEDHITEIPQTPIKRRSRKPKTN